MSIVITVSVAAMLDDNHFLVVTAIPVAVMVAMLDDNHFLVVTAIPVVVMVAMLLNHDSLSVG